MISTYAFGNVTDESIVTQEKRAREFAFSAGILKFGTDSQ